MRELGRLEATRNNSCDCEQREDLTKDLEEVAARVAIAKASMLGAKASNGGCLIEWSEDEANKFFALIDTQDGSDQASG